MVSKYKENIPSKWMLRELAIRLLLLFVVITLLVILALIVLLFSIPSVDSSTIFEFSLIILNLISVYALVTISWFLFRIEQQRDKNQAKIQQRDEWQSIVNQLHELVDVVDEEIRRAYLPSQSSVTPQINVGLNIISTRKISRHYIPIKSHLAKLHELILDELGIPEKVKNRRTNRVQFTVRDQTFQDFQEERQISVEAIREKINNTLDYLEKNNIRSAELEFMDFSKEHYNLTISALNFYELYTF